MDTCRIQIWDFIQAAGKSLIKKEKTNKISVLTPDLPGKQEQVCSILSDPNL